MENILESNKLIAEFMKLDIGHGDMVIDKWSETSKINSVWTKMRFHSDWNWLMEVVEKINSLTDEYGNNYNFIIGNGYVYVDPHIGDRIFFSGNDIGHRDESMIEKVYRGVVTFIKWYKNNKTFI